MTRADVVIVGARCAGAALARLLALAGLRVVVIDRAVRGSDTLSTHALMRGAVLQLAHWNLLEAVRAAGTPVVRRTTFVYDDTPVAIDIEPRDGIDGLYAPRRRVLDTILADAAAAAGADIRYQHRITGVLRDERGHVAGVEVRDAMDRHSTIHARWVVGADGVHSTVAKHVGAPVIQRYPNAAACLYAHWPGVTVDGYRWYFAECLSGGAIPTNDDTTCVFVSTTPARFREQFHGRLNAGFREALADVAPDIAAHLPAAMPPEGYHGFGGHPGQTRQSHGPGWALVGDALSFRDPITAHGITDALRDAGDLADAILIDTPGRWREYDAHRTDIPGPIAALSDQIASFDWTLDEVRELHLQLSRAMGREARAIGAPR